MSFADNSSTNSTELLDNLTVYSGTPFTYIMVSLTCFSIVLFPFYAYLNIVNRPQDSQRAVFSFLNFFFNIMCFSVVVYAFAFGYFAVFLIKIDTERNNDFLKTPVFKSGLYIFVGTFIVDVINMLVCQLLTSILAFHRFLIYFFPGFGDFLTSGKKAIKILILVLYAVVLVGFGIVSRINNNSEDRNNSNKTQNLSLRLYFVGLSLSELLISIPYAFMILSIRRLTHLASAIQSRPEMYIVYQIVITFVLKCISLLGMFHPPTLKKEDSASLAQRFMLADVLTFPLAVQLAYILSNKKNVDTLIAVITGKAMFWKNRARVEVENSTRF